MVAQLHCYYLNQRKGWIMGKWVNGTLESPTSYKPTIHRPPTATVQPLGKPGKI